MRYILLLLLTAVSFVSNSQTPNATYYNWVNGADFGGKVKLPADTLASAKDGSMAIIGGGVFFKNTYWKQVGTAPDSAQWVTRYRLDSLFNGLSGYTPGSVPFAGPSGVLTQDNATFFWDNASKRLGLGTSGPSAIVTIKNNIGSTVPVILSQNSAGANMDSVDYKGNVIIQSANVPTTGSSFMPSLYIRSDNSRTGPATVISSLTTGDAAVGTYTGISPTNVASSGQGLIISTTIKVMGEVAQFQITSAGTGYKPGDVLTIPRSSIGSAGGGSYTIYIWDVLNSNNFSAETAPITIQNYFQQGGATGNNTPMQVWRCLARNNTSIVSDLSLRYYGTGATSYAWSFNVGAVTSLQIGSGNMFSPAVIGNTITASSAITSASYLTGNGFSLTNSYLDNSSSLNPVASFISTRTIPMGAINTYAIINGGIGYTPGTFTQVAVTGGSGTGATVDIVVNTSGVITSITRSALNASPGQNYVNGETISIAAPGGAGSGFTATVNLRTNGIWPVFSAANIYSGNQTDIYRAFSGTPTITNPTGSTGSVTGFYWGPTIGALNGRRHFSIQALSGTALFQDSVILSGLRPGSISVDTFLNVQNAAGSLARLGKTATISMLGAVSSTSMSGNANYIPTYTGSNSIQQPIGLKYYDQGSGVLQVKQWTGVTEPTGMFRGLPVNQYAGYYTYGGSLISHGTDSSASILTGSIIQVIGRSNNNALVQLYAPTVNAGKASLEFGQYNTGNTDWAILDTGVTRSLIFRFSQNRNVLPGIDIMRFDTRDTSIYLNVPTKASTGDTSFLVINKVTGKIRYVNSTNLGYNLQKVTDAGNTTTNQITVQNGSGGNVTLYPNGNISSSNTISSANSLSGQFSVDGNGLGTGIRWNATTTAYLDIDTLRINAGAPRFNNRVTGVSATAQNHLATYGQVVNLITDQNIAGNKTFSGNTVVGTFQSTGFASMTSGSGTTWGFNSLSSPAYTVNSAGRMRWQSPGTGYIDITAPVSSSNNRVQTLQDDNGIIALTKNIAIYGNSAQVATNGTTMYTIPHGQAGITSSSRVYVTPRSVDAGGYKYADIDATNIYIYYSASPTTSSILRWDWEIKQ